MKKSIYSKLLLTSLFVSGVFAGSNTISAKETSSATTDATATFVPDDGATSPVNPTDPSQPGDSSDTGNHSTGNTGLLTLDVAPSKFDFGSNIPASNSAMTINAYPLEKIAINIYKFLIKERKMMKIVLPDGKLILNLLNLVIKMLVILLMQQ